MGLAPGSPCSDFLHGDTSCRWGNRRWRPLRSHCECILSFPFRFRSGSWIVGGSFRGPGSWTRVPPNEPGESETGHAPGTDGFDIRHIRGPRRSGSPSEHGRNSHGLHDSWNRGTHAQSEEIFSEPDDAWDEPIKQEFPEADEIPLPDWAQPANESVEPSLEGFAQEIETPLDNLPSPEEPDQDFLSNLRQSAGVPLESEPIPDLHISEVPLESQPIFPPLAGAEAVESDVEPESFASRIESLSQTPPTDLEPIEKTPIEPEAPSPELDVAIAAAVVEEEVALLDTDPPRGHRYRVVIRGEKAIFPGGDCAHCGRTPVKGNLTVVGSLPDGQNITQRKTTTFKIPLCGECRKRAGQLSEEAKEARLQAHLLSAIGGMLLVVGALAVGIIKPAELQFFDILILAILFVVGYTLPALFLLGRVGKHPPPASASYVRSTLLVPKETQGLETAFEWRNSEYAERFFEANEAHTYGKLSKIKDRSAPPKDLG